MNIDTKEILDDLVRVRQALERTPTVQEYKQHGEYSYSTVRRRFGKWNNALEAAGWDVNVKTDIDREKLLNDIKRVEQELGRTPTARDYDEDGKYSTSTVSQLFGKWNLAIDAAGYDINKELKINREKLLNDINRVGKEVEGTPTVRDYIEHGEYSHETMRRVFGGWNDALNAAGWEVNNEANIDREKLLNDVNRVGQELKRTPTVQEYKEYGEYSHETMRQQFGGWNDALNTAGWDLNKDIDIPPEQLLVHLREQVTEKNIDVGLVEFFEKNIKYHYSTYNSEFGGGGWRAFARAGLRPKENVPLSETKYELYIRTAKNSSNPKLALYGMLRAVVGLPNYIVKDFDMDWIRRLDSDHQPTLLTVPSELLESTDDDWVAMLPPTYTTESGQRKPTQIDSILQWIREENIAVGTKYRKQGNAVKTIMHEAGIDADTLDLRASIVAHLARKGVSKKKIKMQVGDEKTNWDRSVKDYFLYLYQFEDYCHPDYEPSGIFLDPDSGKVRKI